MLQYAKIAVFLVGTLASMPVFAYSPYDPITAPCPSAAMDWTNSGEPKIDWNKIHSEMEARACIRDVAKQLGPKQLRDWFSRNKFMGSIISNSGKRVSGVSHWETDKNGLLYKDNLWNNFVHYFSYGVTISVTWNGDKIVAIGIGHLYE